jgi:hypothetical protein
MSPPRRTAGRIRLGVLLAAGLMAAAAVALLAYTWDGEQHTAAAPTVLAPPAAPPEPTSTAVATPEPAPEVAAPAPMPGTGKPSLLVHNPCGQPLLFAVSHEGASGQRMNDGFYRIEPGTRFAPGTRSGPIPLHHPTLFFYTETVEMEPVEMGDRQEIVADREVGMKRVNLDPPLQTTIELECPGATSGKS